MPFSRVLNIVLSLLLLIVFTGALGGRLFNLLQFVEKQMAAHAQDTATSLALSLGPAFSAGDMAKVSSMMDAVFDRGSYREVNIFTIEGMPLLVHQAPMEILGVPSWLPRLVSIDTPISDAIVMDGWRQAAKVAVAVHPIHAYRELWDDGRQLAQWFAGAWMAATVLVLMVTRWMLAPLHDLERQALAVAEQRFPDSIRLPWTRELRRVAEAMNLMTQRTKEAFTQQASSLETWRDHAFRDKITGLENRASLESHLHRLADDTEASEGGALVLLKFEGLGSYNRMYGRASGDLLLQHLGQCLTKIKFIPTGGILPSHLEGATFALLLPGAGSIIARRIVNDAVGDISRHIAELNLPDSLNIQTGAAFFRGQSAEQWLAEADGALQQALASNTPTMTCSLSPEDASQPSCPGGRDWMGWLDRILNQRDLKLRFQPVITSADSSVLHHEVYVRFPWEGGALQPASLVLPMLYGSGRMGELDRLVVEKILEKVTENPHLRNVRFAVNLSPASLMNKAWMFDMVTSLAHSGLFGSLLFEISEGALIADPEAVGSALLRLREAGSGIGVDRFGAGPGRFGYLTTVKPDYVKIDGGFSQKLTEHRENQFYIQSLAGIARGLGIAVIACALERPEDVEFVKQIPVDGLQGNFIAPATEKLPQS
jgi:EAL domain-containing protein (putative c-di-GMP-specific phosphodiesterase class I)/GGDEF domain-containing protein